MTTPIAADRGTAPPAVDVPAHTGSRTTRVLGVIVLAGLVLLAWLAFSASPPEARVQGDAVRLFYLHVPAVLVAYLACLVTTVASAVWLKRRTEWWDLVASSAAEVGAVFTALTLVSGMVWGDATWGTPWEWDPRLTSTLFLFLLLLGYQGVRAATVDREARSRRAAIVGLLLVPNVVVVSRSVEWWRSLHQDSTLLRTDGDFAIEGLQLFTAMFGLAVALVLFLWLMIHRFRVGWLAERAEDRLLEGALAERRAEAVQPDVTDLTGAPGTGDAGTGPPVGDPAAGGVRAEGHRS